MKTKFFFAEVTKKLSETKQAMLEELGDFYVGKVIEALSIPFPPPSAPGESPHYRTMALIESYQWEIDGNRLRVGSNLNYAKFLELGTSRMRPRPHLLVTIVANMREGQKICESIMLRDYSGKFAKYKV